MNILTKEKIGLLARDKIYYLASPYSHPEEHIRDRRVVDVIDASVVFMHQSIVVFPPIALNGPWTKTHQVRGDWEFWEKYDKLYIDRCDGGLIVLMLDGWDKSIGVTAEIKYAKETNKEIYYVTMETLE